MLHGHDVSSYQGEYNWAAVKGSDAFGFCKATEGTALTDPQFTRNWAQMKTHGLLRGAYHFAHPNLNAPAQAKYFVGVVKAQGLEGNDSLVLDLETLDGLGPSAVSAWAQVFCNTVQTMTGKNVWVYTNHAMILNGCCSGLYTRPLWIASLTQAGAPGSVLPWSTWSFQQYTWNPVDQNVLNGDANTWKALVNEPKPPPVWRLAQYKTTGKETLEGWATSVGHLPSTVLRLTCEHSPGDVFTADVANYINQVFTGAVSVSSPLPKGLVLYYMQEQS
jgi:GH25 family lysozyme M1 (1,4-beta-N-acetylmuramidase)